MRWARRSRSARSSAEGASWVAAAFSRMRPVRRVPGIGTVHGCCASTQDRAVWLGVAPFASARRRICSGRLSRPTILPSRMKKRHALVEGRTQHGDHPIAIAGVGSVALGHAHRAEPDRGDLKPLAKCSGVHGQSFVVVVSSSTGCDGVAVTVAARLASSCSR